MGLVNYYRAMEGDSSIGACTGHLGVYMDKDMEKKRKKEFATLVDNPNELTEVDIVEDCCYSFELGCERVWG